MTDQEQLDLNDPNQRRLSAAAAIIGAMATATALPPIAAARSSAATVIVSLIVWVCIAPRVEPRGISIVSGAAMAQQSEPTMMPEGLTQQLMGKLIGVSYQQAHKYETGINRISAGRLLAIANALGVGVGYFFEGLARECAVEPNAQQRLLLELIRDFTAIPNRKVQEAFYAVARALTAVEPEADNGASPARSSRSRPKPATKAG